MINFLPQFFLASNTPQGFFSLFNHLYYPEQDWFCYIIKGGPGTGKSTLMKKIVEVSQKNKIKTELIYCSSDPNSLDAVIFPEIKKCIVDGTAPHTLDPIYPGISDKIINLGDFWNEKKLKKQKHKLLNLFADNKKFHNNSRALLKFIGKIQNIKNSIVKNYIRSNVIEEYSEKFFKQFYDEFKSPNANCAFGHFEKLRFLDAFTPDGHTFFSETINALCAKGVYIIEDKYDLAANEFLQKIKLKMIANNFDIISCPHPIAPKDRLRAVLIPSIEVAFIAINPLTEKSLFKIKKTYKKINAERFFDLTALKEHKNSVKFYEKIILELEKDVEINLKKALKNHDEIEKIYSLSMNYSQVDKVSNKLIRDIIS
ncbi:MAG: hypothetical protein ACI4PJ_00880 [Acutalibacteraceae bacterium]